jgi:hypothetical protein
MNAPRNITTIVFTCTALLVGVTGGSDATAGAAPHRHVKRDLAKLRSIVLRHADVPAGFSVVLSRSYTPAQIASQGTWTRAQLKKWGYEGGYERQFDRGSSSNNPAQISSDAGVYRTIAGAKSALAANGGACHEGLWSELPLAAKPFGDAAHLCTLKTTIRGYPAQSYFLVWRRGRFKSAVTLTGLQGAVSPNDVLPLARAQLARMKRAL